MKPRDRALCAYAHHEADRVPVFEINVNSPIADETLGHASWVGTGGHAWVQQYGERKARHEERLPLCGNTDVTYILPWGKPDEIRREVLRCLRQGAQGGGYLLSSSNSLHSQIMLDTAREFGRYPNHLDAGEIFIFVKEIIKATHHM